MKFASFSCLHIYFALKYSSQIIKRTIILLIIISFMTLIQVAVLALLVCLGTSVFDITKFGAVPNSDSVADQFKTQRAILAAIKSANQSDGERIVRIPNKKFYSMPIRVQYAHNITIQVIGQLIASKNVRNWPRQIEIPTYYEDFVSFRHSTHITINGSGKIDGRGYHWWMLLFLNDKKYLPDENSRPHLFHFIDCNFTTMHDLVMKNSAQFHVKLDQCHDGLFYNINIKVNTTAQFNLVKKFSIEGAVIMFPFNTDGIDPSGARFYFYNLTVQNYDDVVVPKPQGEADCTRDFLVENCTVILGVGMTVGSVPPEKDCNCVRNITFRNVRMIRPLKGIYIKSNPGDEGTGLIENILYKNFTMDRPVWWAIYIGPQQMKEPDGDGPGCMLYPFDKKGTCTTQPRVTMRNITLEDITIHKSFLYPYTVRCNVSNPCTDINFYNVVTDSWQHGQPETGYVCEYATGKRRGTYPPLHCLDNIGTEDVEMPKVKRDFFSDMFERTLNGFKIGKMLFLQLEKATLEVGYHDQDDDDFDTELNESNILDIGGALQQ